jgi:hypothetical protein
MQVKLGILKQQLDKRKQRSNKAGQSQASSISRHGKMYMVCTQMIPQHNSYKNNDANVTMRAYTDLAAGHVGTKIKSRLLLLSWRV